MTPGFGRAAGSTPAGYSSRARRRSGPSGLRAALSLLGLGLVAAHPAAAAPNTDDPLWRAQHGPLLALARAGNRIVAAGDRGHILLSDDNGTTWRAAKTPTDRLLTSLSFTSPTEGWAGGQDQEILHTTDGGETWIEQHTAKDSDQAVFAVAAISATHVLATGAYNLVLESFDAGATWKDAKIPDQDDDYHLNCIAARGNETLVTGESGHAYTRFAGVWTPVKLPYEGSHFACAVAADGAFLSFGLRGTAFRLPAGGTEWAKIPLPTLQGVFGAATLADGRVALVGANGLLLLLDPASGKVTEPERPTRAALGAAVEGKGGKLIVSGDDGVHVVDVPAAGTAEVTQ